VRELPGKLDERELERLFSGRSRLVAALARREDPLEVAEDVIAELSEDEKIEALNTHPRIGEASAEQHGEEPDVLAELGELNRAYEAKFGFKFVVFVAGRPRREILPVLRERLGRERAEELEMGLRELVAIARDRWTRT
jgi:2-oxo-4-hydroxy-4-carboxy--5-ureidoimidazoline (OHCU) decarboxylase